MHAQSTGKCSVIKLRPAAIVVQRWRVAREVSLDDVQIAVQVIIRRGHAQSRLRLAVSAESAARLNGNVFEFAVLLILVQGAGSRVVGYINVRPSIIIKISNQHPETVSATGTRDSGRLGNVREGTIPVVVVENILPPIQPRRTAGDH